MHLRIKIHQNRVSHCPKEFPAGYFWYGGKRKGTGKPPRWVEELLSYCEEEDASQLEPCDTDDTGDLDKEVGSCETNNVMDTMPAEDTEMNELDIAEDMESDEETVEPTESMPVKRPSTKGTRYSLRGSIKPPHRYL